MPDRLWRGKLPECFATVYLDDPARFDGVAGSTCAGGRSGDGSMSCLLRKGQPDELIDWIDGALLVDLWADLPFPRRSGTPGSRPSISPGTARESAPGTTPIDVGG